MREYTHFKKVSAQDIGRILARVGLAQDNLRGLVKRRNVDEATGYFLDMTADRLEEVCTILESLAYHTVVVGGSDDYADD